MRLSTRLWQTRWTVSRERLYRLTTRMCQRVISVVGFRTADPSFAGWSRAPDHAASSLGSEHANVAGRGALRGEPQSPLLIKGQFVGRVVTDGQLEERKDAFPWRVAAALAVHPPDRL